MAHNINGLDHTLIGVADLEQAREAYEKIGFTLTPRGSHIGWGTANYCIMFDDDYIELLGIVDPALETNGLDVVLSERGEGMLGLALSSDNPDATYQSLKEAGLNPQEPADLKRKLELEEGDVIPEFKLVRLPVEGLSGKGLFICHHLTPELIRKPEWLEHANGASYVKSVVTLVENPEVLRDYYSKLCGVLNVTFTDATLTVRVGKLNLIFVAERDLDLLFPGLTFAADWPELPHLFATTIAVKDIGKTAEYLEGKGFQVQKIASGALRLKPSETSGALVEFVPE